MIRLITVFLLVFMVSNQAGAGGAIGGGTGLIVRQDSPVITQSLFQALVESGSLNQPILFNDLPAKVKTVNFEARTVELNVEGQLAPTVLVEEDEAPAADQPASETAAPATETSAPEAAQPAPEAPVDSEAPAAQE